MKIVILFCSFFLIGSCTQAQNDVMQALELITLEETESEIRFIASDELMGRNIGSIGIEKAAEFIAAKFKKYGLKEFKNAPGYFQNVNLTDKRVAQDVALEIGKILYKQGDNLLLVQGENTNVKAPVIFAGYAAAETLKALPIEGNIVISLVGGENIANYRQFLSVSRNKSVMIKSMGGLGLIELFTGIPDGWDMYLNYLNQPELTILPDSNQEETFPVIWLKDFEMALKDMALTGNLEDININIGNGNYSPVPAKNVIGWIEGSDPVLKNEYVLLGAHYDHIGTRQGDADSDTIYNGARDNGIGTVAIINAAKVISTYKPKRSVIFAGWTAEEKGLLGSRWYTNHPLVSLNQTIFNLNIDGGGYNDTTAITVVGFDRTTAEEFIKTSAAAFELNVINDPVPELNLFDRSDNVNFAKLGVPAPTFSTGFTSFDKEILKYYHQVTDEADDLNFNYLLKYYKAYTLSAIKIADNPLPPFWTMGDKYEPAGKSLYKIN